MSCERRINIYFKNIKIKHRLFSFPLFFLPIITETIQSSKTVSETQEKCTPVHEISTLDCHLAWTNSFLSLLRDEKEKKERKKSVVKALNISEVEVFLLNRKEGMLGLLVYDNWRNESKAKLPITKALVGV